MSGRGRGRGAYYKAKYGGRGGFQQQQGVSSDTSNGVKTSTNIDRTWYTLESDLKKLDGQQYGAYKSLRGVYAHNSPDFALSVDHVQGDAFAAPSRVSVRMPWEDTGFPSSYATSEIRAIALADYLTRTAVDFIRSRHMNASVESSDSGWHGPKGGVFSINSPGQQILPRTSAMVIDRLRPDRSIELRFTVSLPARGRNILGHEAFKILGVNLPDLVKAVLLYPSQDQERLKAHIESIEDQQFMRSQLAERGLIAFIANGAILPRASGASSRPLASKSAVPFQSPPSLEVALSRLHGPDVRGMGIACGVTLLTGGGYHGKSTLLQALQLGIYNHVPGDGRDLVVTDPTAVKVRAEDGRAVTGTDISPFIKDLPGGRSTIMFTTDDASGSTSMAAGIQEALEVGCQTLMIDEDTSATNLLVRDERMQALVRNEPITPLVSKVRALYSEHGVSTLIVVGGLGDWLSVADRVIGMESYIPEDLTPLAKDLVERLPRDVSQDSTYGSLPGRGLQYPDSVTQGRTPWAKTKNFIILPSTHGIKDPSEADNGVDVSGVEQLVESGQTKLIAHTLTSLAKSKRGDDLATEMASFERGINLTSCLQSSLVGGDFVAIRRFEMSATVCRLRGIRAVSAALPTLKKQRIGNS